MPRHRRRREQGVDDGFVRRLDHRLENAGQRAAVPDRSPLVSREGDRVVARAVRHVRPRAGDPHERAVGHPVQFAVRQRQVRRDHDHHGTVAIPLVAPSAQAGRGELLSHAHAIDPQRAAEVALHEHADVHDPSADLEPARRGSDTALPAECDRPRPGPDRPLLHGAARRGPQRLAHMLGPDRAHADVAQVSVVRLPDDRIHRPHVAVRREREERVQERVRRAEHAQRPREKDRRLEFAQFVDLAQPHELAEAVPDRHRRPHPPLEDIVAVRENRGDSGADRVAHPHRAVAHPYPGHVRDRVQRSRRQPPDENARVPRARPLLADLSRLLAHGVRGRQHRHGREDERRRPRPAARPASSHR